MVDDMGLSGELEAESDGLDLVDLGGDPVARITIAEETNGELATLESGLESGLPATVLATLDNLDVHGFSSFQEHYFGERIAGELSHPAIDFSPDDFSIFGE